MDTLNVLYEQILRSTRTFPEKIGEKIIWGFSLWHPTQYHCGRDSHRKKSAGP